MAKFVHLTFNDGREAIINVKVAKESKDDSPDGFRRVKFRSGQESVVPKSDIIDLKPLNDDDWED